MDVVVCVVVVVVGELRLVKILRGFLFWLSIRRFEGGKKKKMGTKSVQE